MNSWEGELNGQARPPRAGDEPGGSPAPPGNGLPAITPGSDVPAAPAQTGTGRMPVGERGVDPYPSTGSLVWAPDPTEQVPVVPGDASVGAPSRPDWPAPSGEPLSSTGGQRSTEPVASGRQGSRVYPDQVLPPRSQAYADDPERPARFARRPAHGASGGSRLPLRPDQLVVGGAVLVLVVAAVALLFGSDGDASDDSEDQATAPTPIVDGGADDPAGPIIGPTGVIGSWSGSEWLPRTEGEQPGAGLEYTILGLGESFDTAGGEAIAEDCAADQADTDTDVAVDLGAESDGPPPIAVAGVAEPRPRPVDQWNTDAPTYQQAAAEVAAGLGATTPPTLTQLLRTDLDGNGTDEIVVTAEHISDASGLSPTAGDWSVVFLRRVASGGVATDVLASSVVGGGGGSSGDGIERIQVATLADLNRDGSMEIALAARSADGGWTSIHAVDGDGATTEVLRAGCEG